MSTLFNQLKFKRNEQFSDSIREVNLEFFIPGVNSGVYTPATLCVVARIKEKACGFFKFKKEVFLGTTVRLTKEEFDQLFSEMEKIKKLRDTF